MEKLLKRSEVPLDKTWDLTKIYSTDEEFELKQNEIKLEIPKLLEYKGKINNSKDLLKFLNEYITIDDNIGKLYSYAHLKNDQDTTNSKYQNYYQKVNSLITEYSSSISWFIPEFLQLSLSDINKFYEEEPELKIYDKYFESILINKEHTLTYSEEDILAQANEVLNSSIKTFSLLNNADLKLGKVKNENGEEIDLTRSIYSILLESNDVNVRKGAFETLYKSYIGLKNTFASTLCATVKNHNFKSKIRKYKSARHASLSSNQVPEEVYDTLVKVVNEKLPLLHRYIELQKKVLNLKEIHMYDLYLPITKSVDIKYNYDEAVLETYNALKPLGEEYASILKEGFTNRWVDVYENVGKRSGAYSSGSYKTAPYILMNWQNELKQFYTLVHEFGHSAHSYLTRKYQPSIYGDYSIFLAEIASTTNENLLTEYLLNKYTDKQSQIYILDRYLNGFKSTVFRQTQFAEFEHKIHMDDEAGIPLTEEYLSKVYAEINAKYYQNVIQDEEIAYEWSRIPHFYMNYYVFQYATGMAAATTLSSKIINGSQEDLNKYLNYLKAGRSDTPIEVMKKAGVDMTKPEYLYKAFDLFEERLNKLEMLFD